ARGGGARLSHRFGLEGLSGHWLAVRHRPATGPATGGTSSATALHARNESRPGRSRREHFLCAAERLLRGPLSAQVRDAALALYHFAAEHALKRGIIVADTKFEFGIDDAGCLTLIDEVCTPDSSRFWPADTYRPGISPPSFDKQFVRDYLETLDW